MHKYVATPLEFCCLAVSYQSFRNPRRSGLAHSSPSSAIANDGLVGDSSHGTKWSNLKMWGDAPGSAVSHRSALAYGYDSFIWQL